MQKLLFFTIAVFFSPLAMSAQLKLDVDGPARIKGPLDLAAGGNSIFIGTNAGAADDGTDNRNIFLGYEAGFSNTTGSDNVFLGDQAGYSNTEGYDNVFLGRESGASNTTGYANTFIGRVAGATNSEGFNNTFLGVASGQFNSSGSDNTFMGVASGQANSTGTYNTFMGVVAGLSNTTGSSNTFVGRSAGLSNTEGQKNTFIGVAAGFSNTAGNRNIFVGDSTGYSNSTGSDNVFLGYQAGYSNIEGRWNVFLGERAGYSNTEGTDNTLIGYQAGYFNTEGKGNVFIGELAGYLNETGVYRTGLGRLANSNGANYDNSTGLGYYADPTGANIVHIGNTSVTSIKGQVSFTTYSDARFKREVNRDEVPGLAFIKELEPVTYHMSVDAYANWKEAAYGERDTAHWESKYDVEKIKFTGFIAQEVEAAAEKIGYDFSGVDKPANDKSFYGIRYATFVVPLVQGMQEQQEMIEEQKSLIESQQAEIEQLQLEESKFEAAISDLQTENEALRNRLDRLEQMMNNRFSGEAPQGQATWLTSARLDQNIPNPFNGQTRIGYFVPKTATGKAEIVITNAEGREVKRLSIMNQGEGFLEMDTSLLSSGSYQYALLIDGRVVATKQMVRVK